MEGASIMEYINNDKKFIQILYSNKNTFTFSDLIDIIQNERKATNNINLSYWLILGDFLDWIYKKEKGNDNTDERKISVIFEKEPKFLKKYWQYWEIMFLAGTAERICEIMQWKKPMWIFKEKYYMKSGQDPYFSMNAKGALRVVFLRESPMCYRKRGIFVSGNVLTRV